MVSGILTKIFGSRNDRLLKQYQRNVGRINALESSSPRSTMPRCGPARWR